MLVRRALSVNITDPRLPVVIMQTPAASQPHPGFIDHLSHNLFEWVVSGEPVFHTWLMHSPANYPADFPPLPGSTGVIKLHNCLRIYTRIKIPMQTFEN